MNTDLASIDEYYSRRLLTAAFILVALLLAAQFGLRPVTLLVMPAVVIIVPIVIVIAHWLGVELYGGQRADTASGTAARLLTFTIAALVAPMITREPDEWFPLIPIIAAVILTAFIVHAIYAWRKRLHKRWRAMGRLTGNATRAHFTGYIIGLAAGIAAAGLVEIWSTLDETWLWSGVAYGIAFATGKLAADLLSPVPARFWFPTLSGALLRMTVVGPLWWGLPWGIAYAGYEAIAFARFWAPREGLFAVIHIAAAVTLVFAALTVLAYAQEVFEGRRAPFAPADVPEGAVEPSDWMRMFWAVVFVSLAAGLLVFEPLGPGDEEIFGTETWKCAKDEGDYKLGWIARDGVHITNHRGAFDFFDLSCVPRAEWRGGCKYDKESWDDVVFVVNGPGGSKAVAFNRRNPDVHWGGLYGKSALSLLEALYEGSSAEMTVRAPKGRVLYVMHIDLKGFRQQLDECAAQWRRNPPPKRP